MLGVVACLPASLPACLRACLPACLPACLLGCLDRLYTRSLARPYHRLPLSLSIAHCGMQAVRDFLGEQTAELKSLTGRAEAAEAACAEHLEELDESRRQMVSLNAEQSSWLQQLLHDKDLLRMIDDDPKKQAFFIDQIRWGILSLPSSKGMLMHGCTVFDVVMHVVRGLAGCIALMPHADASSSGAMTS